MSSCLKSSPTLRRLFGGCGTVRLQTMKQQRQSSRKNLWISMNQNSPIDDTDGVKAQGSTQRRQTHAQKHSEQKKCFHLNSIFLLLDLRYAFNTYFMLSVGWEHRRERAHERKLPAAFYSTDSVCDSYTYTRARSEAMLCAYMCVVCADSVWPCHPFSDSLNVLFVKSGFLPSSKMVPFQLVSMPFCCEHRFLHVPYSGFISPIPT